MNAQELVAWNLRRIRVTRGVSQEALAVDAAIDRTYVSRLERCMENPTVNVLERLAHALDTEITAFFEQPADDAVALPILPSGRKRQKDD